MSKLSIRWYGVNVNKMIDFSLQFVEKIKNNKLATDSFWAIVGNVVGKGLSMISGIVVARFLGKEVFGEFGIIKNTLVYIAIVSTFGFGYTATKYVADYLKNDSNKLNSLVNNIEVITLIFSVVLSIFIAVYAAPIAIYVKAPHLTLVLQMISPLIIFNALTSSQIGVLSGFKLFKDIAKVNMFTGIITFIASVAFTYMWGIVGALFALLVSFVFQYIYNEFIIRKLLNVKEWKCSVISHYERMSILRFSLPIAMQESLYTIVHWLSLYLLIRYANYGEIGLLAAASTWLSIMIFIPGVLKNVMFSHLSSADEHGKLVNRMLQINFICTVVPVLFVVVFHRIICSFYGDTFVGLPMVMIVCVSSAIFICLSEVYCYEFISIGKNWTVFLARFIRDVLILLFSWIFITLINRHYALWMSVVSLLGNMLFLIILHCIYKLNVNKNYGRKRL